MSPKRIIILFASVEIAIVLLVLFLEGYSIHALQTISRFSGRLSLFLFSAIFLLYNKPAIIHAWLSEKFYLLFAIVHGIHLIELLSFIYLSDINLIPLRVAGGFIAYAYIFVMPVLEKYKSLGKISVKNFSILETVYIYYVWLMFFLIYLPRVQGKLPNAGGSFEEHVALLGWTSALLGMKLTQLIRYKRQR